LIDLAPTVLELVGVARPDSMRGRVLRTGDGGGSAADRRSFLADADAAARFRSRIQAPAAAIFIALQGLLAFATVLALAGWARLRRSAVLPTAAVMLLAYFPAVYLARALPLHDAGPGAYYAFVLTVSAALGFAARILGRRHALDPILIALGMIVFVLVVDVTVLGSTLQFNSALGFSPEVAGRFIGFGNAGYAALAAASILLAGLVAHRFAGGRGVKFALALLAVVILADAAPFWGADVGGVLSMVPAFGITALLLLGKQIKARSVLAFGVATLVALAAATGLDLARSPGNRTHLGRLAEQTRDEGSSAFTSVISRKIQLNLSALNSNWRFLVPIVLALVAYLAFWPPRHLILLLRRIPELAIALIGFTILMVLGFALNDSGVVVPGVMLGVLSPVLVALVIPTAASSTPDPRIPRDGDSTALDRPAASV
jgi:hypothetical protein